jgi:hypothetical protein
VLIAKANNSTVKRNKLTVKWEAQSCATYYKLQVRQDAIRSPNLVNERKLTNSRSRLNLERNHEYFWRVRACDETGCSRWSEWWNFRIKE